MWFKGLAARRRRRHERHANFVVNDAGARAADVLEILQTVRESVAREAGVELELEVKVWGPRG